MARKENPARYRPTLTQAGTFQTVAVYQDRYKKSIAGFNVPVEEGFWGLISQIQEIPFGGLATPSGVSIYALATALLASVRELPPAHPLFSKGTTQHKMNPGFALSAAKDAEGVHADYYVNASTPEDKTKANTLNMVWILCENGIYQGDFVYRLVNQLVLTGLVGFGKLQEDGDWTERLFRTYLNTSAYDYLMALFAIWSLALKSGNINTANLIQEGPRKVDLLAACQRVLDDLSLRHCDYAAKAASVPYQHYTGKSLSLALFARWPLINLNDELYGIAGHQLMKIQLTSKFLTKALALARTDEKNGSTKYSQFIGMQRLEGFFSELCDIWGPAGGHFAEYEYDKNTNSRSPDRIAFERHGSSNVVHLFQVKLKALKEASHYGIALDPVLNDLRSGLSELIAQSIRFLFALEKSAAAKTLCRDHEELSYKILNADKYCLVGVVPDLPSIFIFKQLRERVMEEVESTLSGEEKSWYVRSFKGKFIWHIIDLPEFETFITLPKQHRDFYKALYQYLRDSRIDNQIIDSAGTLPRDLRSYLISRFGDVRLPDGTRKLSAYQADLGGIFDAIKSDVGRFFFGTSCTRLPE